MAYTFDVVAYEDFNEDRWLVDKKFIPNDERVAPDSNKSIYPIQALPSDPARVHGCYVHVYDPDNPEDQHFFWAWALMGAFETWAGWWVYIASMADMYGMSIE